jgi:hypothetical protein
MKQMILSGALLIGLAGLNIGQAHAQSTRGQGTGFQDLQALESKRVQLPNGWSLTPVGKTLPLGDLPLNIAVSRTQRYAAVTNNGESIQTIQLIDTRSDLGGQRQLDTEVRHSGKPAGDGRHDQTGSALA